MREYGIEIDNTEKNIYDLGDNFKGYDNEGNKLEVTNYYFKLNEKLYFIVSGEFHFSRYDERYWEKEIVKMKMSAVNTIATYVFWNHHEETKGKFVWSGNRNLRRFIELCKKHHMHVILRVGPFAHGEVRNGGLPDWLYGMPFELRSNNEEYLYYVDRLYKEIELQARGLLFKDGGPIIAVQIENEYMHAGAPWEMTNGISNEWITSGNGGERHMIKLKELAKENGLDVPIYTCTAWGGAMTVFYNYRFKLPYKSVVAMANIKLAGGCNFLGYYVYHGGSNPKSENGAFMNEHATPKISYDYQATLGEFGQVRDSYRELKLLHYFVTGFSENLCPMKTFLPERAEKIDPKDIDTLRYAIRAKDNSGFIFINNFQDHVESKDQTDFKFNIKMKNGEIVIPKKGTMNLKKDCSCILPYNLNLNGINLEYSTTQLITTVDNQDKEVYFFFIPEGMTGTYCFNNNDLKAISMHEGNYSIINNHIILEVNDKISYLSIEGKKGQRVNICTLPYEIAMKFWKIKDDAGERAIICNGNLSIIDGEIKIENINGQAEQILIYPDKSLKCQGKELNKGTSESIFSKYNIDIEKRDIKFDVESKDNYRSIIRIGEEEFKGLKDISLKIHYDGDIASAFIDGELIADNFNNRDYFKIYLKRFEERIVDKGLSIYIAPIRKGGKIKSDSTMAAISEESREVIGKIKSIEAVGIKEISIK